ncbi:hypothetical protein NKW84_10360 [Acetobacter senegalensis]|uniref:hypothetical protein n=1 Tax=Acetobacter senegalensis TaxID=446692 RepID=UPI0020A0740C|nr:hypothetical protein [Acetobacter senegalensis]MCG4273224.1 hypothetical protein [Acetobacter senegalensis]MCP1196260.1 hypothetical protein [Acetobacter senegalensis]
MPCSTGSAIAGSTAPVPRYAGATHGHLAVFWLTRSHCSLHSPRMRKAPYPCQPDADTGISLNSLVGAAPRPVPHPHGPQA